MEYSYHITNGNWNCLIRCLVEIIPGHDNVMISDMTFGYISNMIWCYTYSNCYFGCSDMMSDMSDMTSELSYILNGRHLILNWSHLKINSNTGVLVFNTECSDIKSDVQYNIGSVISYQVCLK